jgi:hypothetical protein
LDKIDPSGQRSATFRENDRDGIICGNTMYKQGGEYDNNKVYRVGDIVTFKGAKYKMVEAAGAAGYAPDRPGDSLWKVNAVLYGDWIGAEIPVTKILTDGPNKFYTAQHGEYVKTVMGDNTQAYYMVGNISNVNSLGDIVNGNGSGRAFGKYLVKFI